MNRIEEFVSGFIPKNLSKKRTAALRDELTCHILDKADFYKEIGYGEQESISKAMGDFGDDDSVRAYLSKEFEELYSEKSIFGIAAFIIIAVMNMLCFAADLWVLSADYNRDPDGISAFCSFVVIFVVILMSYLARVKKFSKTLVSIGVVNFLMSVTMLWCMYPQMAGFTICYDALYLIDHLTPFCVGNFVYTAYEGTIALLISLGIPMAIALYCFVQAFRISKARAGDIPQWGKKLAVFSAAFLAFSVGASLICEKSESYVEDYPRWFYEYSSYPGGAQEQMLIDVPLGSSYEQACQTLRNAGFYTLEDYKNLVDPVTRKQFIANLKIYDFEEGFEIWYKPREFDSDYWGNGLIGIRKKGGKVTAIGIGCLEAEMYKGKYNDFTFSDYAEKRKNLTEMKEYFFALEKGASEEEVMGKYRRDFGMVYSKRYYLEKGSVRSYYRVYSYGKVPDAPDYTYGNGRIYTELSFRNGEFVSGKIYEITYDENYESNITVTPNPKKQ